MCCFRRRGRYRFSRSFLIPPTRRHGIRMITIIAQLSQMVCGKGGGFNPRRFWQAKGGEKATVYERGNSSLEKDFIGRI